MCYYVPLRETEEEKLLWVIMYYLKTFKKAPAKTMFVVFFLIEDRPVTPEAAGASSHNLGIRNLRVLPDCGRAVTQHIANPFV